MVEVIAGLLLLTALGFFSKKKKEVANYNTDIKYDPYRYVEIEIDKEEEEKKQPENKAIPG